MTERLQDAFAACRRQRRIALAPFVTVGYPSLDATEAIVKAAVDAGADLVELGIPFSDPLAEGPTIQRSSFHALGQGVTPATCIGMASRLRAAGVDVPMVLMGYYNPILAYGAETFCRDAAEAGADGLIVPDLPWDESGPLRSAASKAGLGVIPMIAPTSTDGRIRDACETADGFVYCVSVTGVTGARSALSERVRDLVKRVKAHTKLPAAVGFGISNPGHVAAVAEFADAAVVGSALVEIIAAGPEASAAGRVREFIANLARGTALPGGNPAA